MSMMFDLVQIIISGLLLGGIYTLVSMGLTLIFGVTKIVNFAHGEFLMLGMYATYWIFELYGIEPYEAVFIVLPLFLGLGVLVYMSLVKQLVNKQDTVQIFATLGLSILLQNIALLAWKADYRTINLSYSAAAISLSGINISVPRLVAFVIAMLITVGLFLFLKYTFVGKAIRAVSQDINTAQLMGIKIGVIYSIACAIGIGLAGLAGLLLMPAYYVFPTVGSFFTLAAFVVVVMGGMGNLKGTLFAGFLIGVVESFSGFFIASELKEAIYFILFILILFVRPGGLFGVKEVN